MYCPLHTGRVALTYVLSPSYRKGSTQTLGGGRRNTSGAYAKLNSMEGDEDAPKKSKRTMTLKQGKKSASVASSPPTSRKSENRLSTAGDRSSIISSDDSQRSTYEDVRDLVDQNRLSGLSGSLPAPPTYPAPRPPSMLSDEDDMDVKHSYEKVQLNPTTGGVSFVETEEWAPLPGARDHPMYQHGLGKQAPPTKDSPKLQPKDTRNLAGSSGSGNSGSGNVGSGGKGPVPRQDSISFVGKTSGHVFESLYDGLASVSPSQPMGSVPEPITENVYEFDRLPESPTHPASSEDNADSLGTLPAKKGFAGRKLSPTVPAPLPPTTEPLVDAAGTPPRPQKAGSTNSPPRRVQPPMAAAAKFGEDGGSPRLALPSPSPSHLLLPTDDAGGISIVPPALPVKKRGEASVGGSGTGQSPGSVVADVPPRSGNSMVSSGHGVSSRPPYRAVEGEAAPIPTKAPPLPPIDDNEIYGFDSLSPQSPPPGQQIKATRPLPQPLPDDGNQDYTFDVLTAEEEDSPPQSVNRPLPQSPPNDGNQDYAFELPTAEDSPAQAVNRPLPQPPPDDGNQDYTFDGLLPLPQPTNSVSQKPLPLATSSVSMRPPPQTTSSVPARSLPQPPPDDGNQDYTFDGLLPLPQPTNSVPLATSSVSVRPPLQTTSSVPVRPLPQPPPDDGNQDYTFDALIPPPQTINSVPTRALPQPPPGVDDGNQDYTFDSLIPSPPPPLVPFKTDTASQSSKPKSTSSLTTGTVATPPRTDPYQTRPLPPPPEDESGKPPSMDIGDQGDTLPPPPPPKSSTPAQGKPPLVAPLKPSQSPPVPPKGKPKGSNAPGTPSGSVAQTQDSSTASARSVAMPTMQPSSIPSKPVPIPSKTLKPVYNLTKAGSVVTASLSDSSGAAEAPPPLPPFVGGMPSARPDPDVRGGTSLPRKPAPFPQTLPDAKPTVATPIGVPPATPKGSVMNNFQSVTAEYCLLGHEESPGNDSRPTPPTPSTPSTPGGMKGRSGGTEPISVPSKIDGTPSKQPPRRNMPVS